MKNYLSKMLDALTSAYSRKDYNNVKRGSPVETNIGKLFSIFAWGLELAADQAELIKQWDDLDNAKGKVLDRYGANFGVRRLGATDEYYRLAIKVKLLSQLSGGDINTMLNAAAALFEVPVEDIDLTENFPAKIGIDVDESLLSEDTLNTVADIATMLKRLKGAGVGLVTTLRKYRQFEEQVSVEGAAFDYTKLEFDLPDVRHEAEGEETVKTAVFARSVIYADIPEVCRIVCGMAAVKTSVFEYSQITVRAVC